MFPYFLVDAQKITSGSIVASIVRMTEEEGGRTKAIKIVSAEDVATIVTSVAFFLRNRVNHIFCCRKFSDGYEC